MPDNSWSILRANSPEKIALMQHAVETLQAAEERDYHIGFIKEYIEGVEDPNEPGGGFSPVFFYFLDVDEEDPDRDSEHRLVCCRMERMDVDSGEIASYYLFIMPFGELVDGIALSYFKDDESLQLMRGTHPDFERTRELAQMLIEGSGDPRLIGEEILQRMTWEEESVSK